MAPPGVAAPHTAERIKQGLCVCSLISPLLLKRLPALAGCVHIVAHLAEVGQDGVCIRLHHCQAPVSSDGSYQNRFGDLWGRDMHRLVVHVRANLRKGRCQPMALDATLAEGAPHKALDIPKALRGAKNGPFGIALNTAVLLVSIASLLL